MADPKPKAPWEEYQQPAQEGPWAEYAQSPSPDTLDAKAETQKAPVTNDLERAMQGPWYAPTMYGLNNVYEGGKQFVQGLGTMLDPRVHSPEEQTAANIAGPGGAVAYRMGKGLYDVGKQVAEVPGALRDIAASPDPDFYQTKALADTAGQAGGQMGAMAATEGLVRGAVKGTQRINQATRPLDPNASITEGLHVPTKSPKMQAAIRDVEGSRPYLKGAKTQAELQQRLPAAKDEVWEPYKRAVDMIKDHKVAGPDGPTTVGELEQQRLKLSAEQQAARKVRPTDQQTAIQAQRQQAALREQYKNVTSVLDQELRGTGIDPEAIRRVHGNLTGVERNVSGKSTVTEAPVPGGLRKIIPYKAPGALGVPEWQWKPIEGIRDMRTGQAFGGKPTDLGIQRIFREGGPKPDFGTPIRPVSGGSQAATARSQYIRPIMTGEAGEPARPIPAGETAESMRRTPTQTRQDIAAGVSRDPQLAELEARQRGRANEVAERYPVSNYPQTLQPYGEGLVPPPPEETTPTSFYERYGRIKR